HVWTRGMIVPRTLAQAGEGGQNSAYGRLRHFSLSTFHFLLSYFLFNRMSSYLVTGGAGFIGSHLTEELIRRGERVRVADSLITGHRKNLAHLSGVEFLEGDVADLAFATRAVQGVD